MKNISLSKLALILISTLFFTLCNFNNNIFLASNIDQDLDLKRGVSITYEADTDKTPTAKEMMTEIHLIQQRLYSQGYTKATVIKAGDNRIIVNIPEINNADTIIETIVATPKLSIIDEEGTVWLTSEDIKDAKSIHQKTNIGKEYLVELTFNNEGSKKFEEATGANIGAPLIIMLDDKILSRPIVTTQIIGDTCVISGTFTKETSENLAKEIKAGSIPFSLKAIQVESTDKILPYYKLETIITNIKELIFNQK